MAYRYVLDIEISEGKHDEVMGLAEEFRRLGANFEVLIPQMGNVHSILAVFHFETLAQIEELMQRAGDVEELMKLEHQFHSLMRRSIYNLYSILD